MEGELEPVVLVAHAATPVRPSPAWVALGPRALAADREINLIIQSLELGAN
ncbi:hypothetical protein [Haladaptatus sp. NG-WS-4]